MVEMLILLPHLRRAKLKLPCYNFLYDTINLSTVNWNRGRLSRGAWTSLTHLEICEQETFSNGNHFMLILPVFTLPNLRRFKVSGVHGDDSQDFDFKPVSEARHEERDEEYQQNVPGTHSWSRWWEPPTPDQVRAPLMSLEVTGVWFTWTDVQMIFSRIQPTKIRYFYLCSRFDSYESEREDEDDLAPGEDFYYHGNINMAVREVAPQLQCRSAIRQSDLDEQEYNNNELREMDYKQVMEFSI